MRSLVSVLALFVAAACSGGSSSDGGTAGAGGSAPGDSGLRFDAIAAATPGTDMASQGFAATVDAFQADVAAVDDRPLADYNFTAFSGIPSSSSASYSGLINVNAGATANLAAGLDIVANFGNETLTATQTSAFYANSGGTLVPYAGTLAYSNGTIGARGTPNNVRLDIAGSLTGAGNTVVVDGEILGKLVGTPIVGISANTSVAEAAALSNPDRAMSITLNGTAVPDGSAGFVVIDDTLR